MNVSPFAGKLVEPSMLVDVSRLITAYYTEEPDPSEGGAGGKQLDKVSARAEGIDHADLKTYMVCKKSGG